MECGARLPGLQQMKGRDKVMMLRFGTVSSLQHLHKNPGQAVRGVLCVWKWLPDGSDQVSGWRQREESGCFCKLIPAATKWSLGEEEASSPLSVSFWFIASFSHPLFISCLSPWHSRLFHCLHPMFYLSFERPCFSLCTRYSIHACHLTPQSLHNYAHKYCEISYRVHTTCCILTLPCDTCQVKAHDLI